MAAIADCNHYFRGPSSYKSWVWNKIFGKTSILQSVSCFKVIRIFNCWLNEKLFSYLSCGSNVMFYLFWLKELYRASRNVSFSSLMAIFKAYFLTQYITRRASYCSCWLTLYYVLLIQSYVGTACWKFFQKKNMAVVKMRSCKRFLWLARICITC